MAIVLAIVIIGWLVAFALGSQAGFNNERTVTTRQPSVAVAKADKPANYQKPMSAS